LVSDVLKGILWDSTAINSEGSEAPTGLRKYDIAWSSTGIKISAARAYQERKVNSRLDSREVRPNVLEKDEIYLESLVLILHLRIEAWRG
jgi:hypothetical protein